MTGHAEKLDKLVAEIAARHQIVVDRHDPLLLTYTLNAQLWEDGCEAQAVLLKGFRAEMAQAVVQWEAQGEKEAARMTAAAVTAVGQQVQRVMEEAVQRVRHAAQAEMAVTVADLRQEVAESRRNAWLVLVAAVMAVCAAAMVLYATWPRHG